MRAFVLTEFGAAPELVDLDVPEPAEGEVRVHVHAASVNGFDLSVAKGYLKDMMEHRFPVVLGKDFAGVVDAVGSGVNDYQIGDRVFGVVTKPYLGDGSFAEYVTVPTDVGLAKLPTRSTSAPAPPSGSREPPRSPRSTRPRYGRVSACSSSARPAGVGNQTVQLTAKAGATVIATATSDEEKALVTDLGAHLTVDHNGDLVDAVRQAYSDGADVIFHLAGDPAPLVTLVRPGGRFVSTLVQPEQLPAEDVTVIGIYTHPDPAKLDRAANHQVEGARLEIQDAFPLEQAPAALEAFTTGTLGKLVITAS